MMYQITARGMECTDEVREYAERRYDHVARLIGRQKTESLLQTELELRSGEAGAPYTVRATLDVARQPPLYVEARGATLHEAIDRAAQALAHEAEKLKGRRLDIRRSASRVKDFLRGLTG